VAANSTERRFFPVCLSQSTARRRSVRAILSTLATVLALASWTDRPNAASPTIPSEPSAASLSIHDLMLSRVAPSSDALWGVGEPASDEDWRTVARNAGALVEASDMLLESRPVVGADKAIQGSDDPGSPTPESIERGIREGPDEWRAQVGAARAAGRELVSAAQQKNPDRLLTASDALATACESCHQRFWYGNAVQ
jgi:hypothetical protein